MNEKELYQKAMAEYGVDIQLVVLMEECGELVKECSKIIRSRYHNYAHIDYKPFIEELVDTLIMIEQVRYGWLDGLEQDFQDLKESKLNKVRGWLQVSLPTRKPEDASSGRRIPVEAGSASERDRPP